MLRAIEQAAFLRLAIRLGGIGIVRHVELTGSRSIGQKTSPNFGPSAPAKGQDSRQRLSQLPANHRDPLFEPKPRRYVGWRVRQPRQQPAGMTSPQQPTDLNPLPTETAAERTSRLLWWLHPKVALPLTLLGLLLVAPFLYRGYCISRIPDIGDPFDVEAFGTVAIPPIDNAMTQYALAVKSLRKPTGVASDDFEKALEHGWTQTSEPLRKWLADNQVALAEWRKGTERSQAAEIPPKDFRFSTLIKVTSESRELTRLAILQAERCAHESDLDNAWDWLRASVRASRHVQQNGALIQRLVGMAMFYNSVAGIKRWAAHPAVTPDQLRKALTEFRDADRLTPPNSIALKTEYLCLTNTVTETSRHELMQYGLGIHFPPVLQSTALYVMGDPELSLKAFQHVFANLLSEIDKPKCDRAPSAGGRFNLYDLPPGMSRCLTARELDTVTFSAYLARSTLPAYQQVGDAMDREAARRAAVSLLLTCQLHHRLHGDWPEKVGDLVPDTLAEPPGDPLGKSGELMRLKRDGEDLVIYSVGLNSNDDGGNIGDAVGANPNEAPDQGVRAKRPTNSLNPMPSETILPEKN